MTKRRIVLYLEPNEIDQIRAKAIESGFHGKANITKFISKVASTDVAFLDANLRKVLAMLRVEAKAR